MITAPDSPTIEANATLVAEDEKQLLAVVEQNHLQVDTAESLQKQFAPLFGQARSAIEKSRGIVVTDASQSLAIKMARVCRLELKAIRVAGEKTRREIKEESLRRSKAIDGFAAILNDLIATEETRLEQQEKFAEIQESNRKAALKAEREKVLVGIQVDPNLYQCGEMTEETFQQLVEGTKLARAAEAERNRKEQADRIEREAKEQAERERIRMENERLKKEAADKDAARIEGERKAAIEREMAEKELRRLADEQRAAVLKAKQEREAAEKETARQLAEQKRISDVAAAKEREAAEAKARAEREEHARKVREMEQAAAELRAKEKAARDEIDARAKAAREAEENRVAEEKETARRAAMAPDKDRLLTYANAIRALEIPTFSTTEGKAIATTLAASRDRFVNWCDEKAGAL